MEARDVGGVEVGRGGTWVLGSEPEPSSWYPAESEASSFCSVRSSVGWKSGRSWRKVRRAALTPPSAAFATTGLMRKLREGLKTIQ